HGRDGTAVAWPAAAALSLPWRHGRLGGGPLLLGADRAAVGAAVGTADAPGLRLRGSLPEAAGPLDVVARDRRTRRRRRRTDRSQRARPRLRQHHADAAGRYAAGGWAAAARRQ